MGQCNFCTHKTLRRMARKQGLAVTTKPDQGGTIALKHPPDVDPDHDKHFAAWYMKLPKECTCAED